MRSLALLFLLICSPTLHAQSLSDIDQFLGNLSFEDSFHVGDQFILKDTSCILHGKCDTFNRIVTVQSLNADSAIVVYDSEHSTGTPQPVTVTKSDWLAWNGNLLRNMFRNIESFGQTPVITGIVDSDYRTPDGATFKAKKVVYDIKSGRSTSSTNVVYVVREFPGAAQIASHEEDASLPMSSQSLREVTRINRILK
jgi:hypothetical protein